jgi:hypothetical protein
MVLYVVSVLHFIVLLVSICILTHV